MNKKLFKRIAVMTMTMIMLLMSFTPIAYARSIDHFTFTTAQYGANAEVFYVNTKSKSTTKIEYNSTKGQLSYGSGLHLQYRYGLYEIKIWGRNSTSESWTYIKKLNIKDGHDTISFKGYTQYKVRVYAWNTRNFGTTLGSTYGTDSYWVYIPGSFDYRPTITFTPYSNVKNMAVV